VSDKEISFDLRLGVYNREIEMLGRDVVKYSSNDTNLMDFVEIFQTDDLFVSFECDESKTAKQCEIKTHPCKTLFEGKKHMRTDYENKYLVIGEVEVEKGVEFEDVIFKTLD
jgi:hypothetical protein